MSETNNKVSYISVLSYLLGGLFVHTIVVALFTLIYNYIAPDFSLPSLHMGKIACIYLLTLLLKYSSIRS